MDGVGEESGELGGWGYCGRRAIGLVGGLERGRWKLWEAETTHDDADERNTRRVAEGEEFKKLAGMCRARCGTRIDIALTFGGRVWRVDEMGGGEKNEWRARTKGRQAQDDTRRCSRLSSVARSRCSCIGLSA